MKERRRILAIAREPSLRSFVQDQLGGDAEVVTAASIEAGLQCLQRDGADVALLEMGPCDAPALAALRELTQRSAPLPVVVAIAAEHDPGSSGAALRSGAYDCLSQPLSPERLRVAIDRADEHARLLRENVSLRQLVQATRQFPGLVGGSKQIQDLKSQIEKVADSRGTILLTGESGTGKELVARAIHKLSLRRSGPYVKLSCSAISESLLESELFGQEKGAAANSTARKEGLFELARGGTLVLDDIGHLPSGLQPRLLRALQEREVTRVGGKVPVKIDVRIIATTGRDPRALVRSGSLQEELYYRLNVIPIEISPLRERRADIPILARHFVERACAENGRPLMHITPGAMDALVAYPWPGNVRELENVLERTVILNEGDSIDRADLRLDNDLLLERPFTGMDKDDLTLRQLERELILRRLSLTGGNRTRAALLLGISVRTLRNKINQYRGEGIKIPG